MDNIINSIKTALDQKNYYAALFVALTLPDICVALEYGKTAPEKYSQWFGTNLIQYKGFLSGDDCYALRCALLHEGKDNITDQKRKDVLEHYIFSTSGNHKILFKDCVFNGTKESFLQLNVEEFCKDISTSAQAWLKKSSGNHEIQRRIPETIEIRDPGYTYKGIKFS